MEAWHVNFMCLFYVHRAIALPLLKVLWSHLGDLIFCASAKRESWCRQNWSYCSIVASKTVVCSSGKVQEVLSYWWSSASYTMAEILTMGFIYVCKCRDTFFNLMWCLTKVWLLREGGVGRWAGPCPVLCSPVQWPLSGIFGLRAPSHSHLSLCPSELWGST